MRKRVLTPTPQGIRPHDEGWLDLDHAASVEVTSEERDYVIDSALVSGEAQGWRAASPGTQTVRLLFDHPQRLRPSRSFSKKPRQRVPKSLSCDYLALERYLRWCSRSPDHANV